MEDDGGEVERDEDSQVITIKSKSKEKTEEESRNGILFGLNQGRFDWKTAKQTLSEIDNQP
ncbi:hypothetical protein FRX31_024279 [Thalictrum thalictroides]|uniref:Uncharacterized protein n=1 Tax=Thalictrum thalictroides TaxID=46969 RepID=A0A7J6VM08_THATH|nr:hypothetical protein FRX31_024279 [Thalictrum thalictroides]